MYAYTAATRVGTGQSRWPRPAWWVRARLASGRGLGKGARCSASKARLTCVLLHTRIAVVVPSGDTRPHGALEARCIYGSRSDKTLLASASFDHGRTCADLLMAHYTLLLAPFLPHSVLFFVRWAMSYFIPFPLSLLRGASPLRNHVDGPTNIGSRRMKCACTRYICVSLLSRILYHTNGDH
jgi:hypothetical protein